MNNWAYTLASTYVPPSEISLLAQTGDMSIFMDWFCKKKRIMELTQKDLEGPAFEIVKVFHPNVIHLQHQIEECHKLLTDQVDDAIIRHNVSKPTKIGVSQFMMWIVEDCKYDIAAMYGISHWWFQRQRFYINRHTSEGDRKAVQTHMRILSVVRIECHSLLWKNIGASMRSIRFRTALSKDRLIEALDYQGSRKFKCHRKNPGLRYTSFRTRKVMSKEARSSCLPFINGLRQGGSSITWKALLVEDFRNSDACYHDPEKCEHASPKVTTSHGGNTTIRMIWRFTMADDLKECSKITQVKGTKLKDHYIMNKEINE
ncbi:hypothetical protein Tco_0332603 [Tanacetum coccineum]